MGGPDGRPAYDRPVKVTGLYVVITVVMVLVVVGVVFVMPGV